MDETVTCPVCAAPNDAWRPFCTRCSQSLASAQPVGAAQRAAGRVLDGPVAAPTPWIQPGAPSAPANPAPGAGAPPPPPAPPGAPAGFGAPPAPPRYAGPRGTPLGTPGAPPPGPAPIRTRSASRVLALRIAVIAPIVAVLVVGGAAGVLWLTRSGESYPKLWDPRIAPLAHYVEQTRGLTFRHPVAVDFVPEAKFRALVTRDAPTSAEDRQSMDRAVAMLRALGLMQGSLDLVHASNTLDTETILAFYSPTTHRIEIRSTNLDVATRVTVVHELTHALQDQHFDLRALQKYGELHNTDAVRALYEGDAVSVQTRYEQTLSASERAEYRREHDQFGSHVDVSTVPDALVVAQQWPYDFGPNFVTILREAGGARLDDAFRRPPRADAQIIDPRRFLGDVRPITVTAVAPQGAQHIDHPGGLGMLGWMLLLSERNDARAALSAIDGWAGDDIVTYQMPAAAGAGANRTCATVVWMGENPSATARVASLLRPWQAAMHEADAQVTAAGARLTVTACDPGVLAHVDAHRVELAYTLLTVRDEILGGLVHDHAVLDRAWCAANHAVAQVPDSAVAHGENAAFFTGPAFKQQMLAAVHAC